MTTTRANTTGGCPFPPILGAVKTSGKNGKLSTGSSASAASASHEKGGVHSHHDDHQMADEDDDGDVCVHMDTDPPPSSLAADLPRFCPELKSWIERVRPRFTDINDRVLRSDGWQQRHHSPADMEAYLRTELASVYGGWSGRIRPGKKMWFAAGLGLSVEAYMPAVMGTSADPDEQCKEMAAVFHQLTSQSYDACIDRKMEVPDTSHHGPQTYLIAFIPAAAAFADHLTRRLFLYDGVESDWIPLRWFYGSSAHERLRATWCDPYGALLHVDGAGRFHERRRHTIASVRKYSYMATSEEPVRHIETARCTEGTPEEAKGECTKTESDFQQAGFAGNRLASLQSIAHEHPLLAQMDNTGYTYVNLKLESGDQDLGGEANMKKVLDSTHVEAARNLVGELNRVAAGFGSTGLLAPCNTCRHWRLLSRFMNNRDGTTPLTLLDGHLLLHSSVLSDVHDIADVHAHLASHLHWRVSAHAVMHERLASSYGPALLIFNPQLKTHKTEEVMENLYEPWGKLLLAATGVEQSTKPHHARGYCVTAGRPDVSGNPRLVTLSMAPLKGESPLYRLYVLDITNTQIWLAARIAGKAWQRSKKEHFKTFAKEWRRIEGVSKLCVVLKERCVWIRSYFRRADVS
ncbi:unnamed protein product [Vitrella brassicaformis CCMP3155]|uniref:Uncharacterized protein n=2 Tax=Vitrella brassicaformis TaxID=1169539 RepID=A0A0G4FTD6_VITBC|nr:unnamed protein product [Vitrella brassicaformis CCMP3155]|eukprot:CEM17734.1 unnamed protein product [Vitrella brassicaformis CCMP3155]